MRNLSQIANLLTFLSQNSNWQQVLRNNCELYNFRDVHEELLNGNNNYQRYFRIYINRPNTSITVHRIHCPDKMCNSAEIIEPSDNGIWLGYFRFPDNIPQIPETDLQNLIERINPPNLEIPTNNRFLTLLLLVLAEYLINTGYWKINSNSRIVLRPCDRCW